jgi:hypothetical protein
MIVHVDQVWKRYGRFDALRGLCLQVPVNGRRNPQTPYCEPSYAPLRPHFLADAMSHFVADVKFHDLQQLAKYPVDGPQLTDARVERMAHEPVAHFVRRLVITSIRLGNWAARTTQPAGPKGAT